MRLRIEAELDYRFARPTAVLLALEVASQDDQTIVADELVVDGSGPLRPIPGECGVGRRTWASAEVSADADARFHARYAATVDIDRAAPDWSRLRSVAPCDVPGEAVQFLWPSRYCQSDRLCSFVGRTFGGLAGGNLTGGAKVEAMAAWIADRIDYAPGSSDVNTTALDSFVSRRGVCRDYAHLMVAFARAADIPARIVAAYGLGVDPPDFHAVAEVWLADDDDAGGWHLVDATGMTRADGIARIAVGRDATDISFMTSFGAAVLVAQKVRVRSVV